MAWANKPMDLVGWVKLVNEVGFNFIRILSWTVIVVCTKDVALTVAKFAEQSQIDRLVLSPLIYKIIIINMLDSQALYF